MCPLKSWTPGIPGSFGVERVPVEVTTYVARNASPRSVVTVHVSVSSSQVSEVTEVENRASR
ncbi:hypothetical protein SHIRM173S_06264 [Streptomyces hirsutus]